MKVIRYLNEDDLNNMFIGERLVIGETSGFRLVAVDPPLIWPPPEQMFGGEWWKDKIYKDRRR